MLSDLFREIIIPERCIYCINGGLTEYEWAFSRLDFMEMDALILMGMMKAVRVDADGDNHHPLRGCKIDL